MDILTYCRLSTGSSLLTIVQNCLNYNNFLKFKMASVLHVAFSKTWLLTSVPTCAVAFPPRYQI